MRTLEKCGHKKKEKKVNFAENAFKIHKNVQKIF